MNLLFILYIFILGTLIGSFINVVSLRYNTGMPLARGRSKCFTCSKKLRWYQMIPIISFLLQKGRCNSCKSKISLQYPVVEFMSGVIFLVVALRQYDLWPVYQTFNNGFLYSVLLFVFYAVLFSLLFVVVLYDIKHKTIPDAFAYAFIVMAVLKLGFFFYLNNFTFRGSDILDISAPFILFIPFALMWFLSKGKWMGFGDAKLVFGIGACLGFVSGVNAVVLAFWIGAIWSLYLITRSYLKKNWGKKTGISLETEVPFAPFLVLGMLIVFFTQVDLVGLGGLISSFY